MVPLKDLQDGEVLQKHAQSQQTKKNIAKLRFWQNKAQQVVESHCCFIEETLEDSMIVQKLRDSAALQHKPDSKKKEWTGILYNPCHCGESSSKASTRPPPLRQGGEHLRKMTGLYVQARGGSMGSRDLLLINDVGRVA